MLPLARGNPHTSSPLSPSDRLANPLFPPRFSQVVEQHRTSRCTVYLAFDEERGQRVGLRRLHEGHVYDPLTLKSAWRALSAGGHPHLARVYDFSEDLHGWYCIQEPVFGPSWLTFWASEFPAAREMGAFTDSIHQITRALDALHQAGWVHGDLTEGSLRREEGGRWVLTHPFLLAPEDPDRAQREEVAAWGALVQEALKFCPPGLHLPPEWESLWAANEPISLAKMFPLLTHRDPLVDSPRPLFQGRQRELASLSSALQTAHSGRAVIVFLHSQPGMGRSAILEQFEQSVEARAQVFRGRCHPRESVPYKAIDELVDHVAGWMRRLPAYSRQDLLPSDWETYLPEIFPVLASASRPTGSRHLRPEWLRQRAVESGISLFRRISEARPIVVSLEDVQWGDADSAQWFCETLLGLANSPILAILTFHSGSESTPFLERILSDPRLASLDLRTLEIPPLSPDEAKSMVLSGYPPCQGGDPSLLEHLVAEGRGLPWLTHILARRACDLHQTGPINYQFITLDAHFQDEIRSLSAPALALLEGVCLAGRPLSAALAAQVAGLKGQLTQALSILERRGLVRVQRAGDEEVITPAYGDLLEMVLSRIHPAKAVEMHRAMARAMAAAGGDEGTIADHWLAGENLDAAARVALVGAHKAGQTLAYGEAVRLYRLALEVGRWQGDERARIGTLLGNALLSGNRPVDAARCWLDAAQGAPLDIRLDLERQAAAQLMISGHAEEGLQVVEGLLERMGEPPVPSFQWVRAAWLLERSALWVESLLPMPAPSADPTVLQRVEVYAFLVHAMVLLNPVYGFYFHSRHLRLARRAGDRWGLNLGYAMEAVLQANRGHADETARALRVVGKLVAASEETDHELRGIASLAHGVTTYLLGHPHRSEGTLKEAFERLYQVPHLALETGTAQMFYLRAILTRGDLKLAKRLRADWLATAFNTQNRLLASLLRSDIGIWLPLADDRPDLAHRDVSQSLQGWSQQPWNYVHQFTQAAEVMVLAYEGRHRDALEIVAQDASADRQMITNLNETVGIRHHFFVCALCLETSLQPELLKFALGRLRRSRLPVASAYLRVLTGQQRLGRARVMAWQTALAQFESLNMELYAATLKILLGREIGGDGGAALESAGRSALLQQGIVRLDRFSAAMGMPSWRD